MRASTTTGRRSASVRRSAGFGAAVSTAVFALMGSLFYGIVDGAPSAAASASPSCSTTLPAGTVVGMAATPDGKGYWIASSAGTVASCGDAPALGNGVNGTAAITAAPDGDGYWLVTQSGQIEAFGSAVNHGELPAGTHLAKPIVAMAADPATGGYWLLGGDGGVFSYDAPFYGSTGDIRLNEPAVGMAATPSGNGYYFVASDGGIFAFGKAPFYGSTGNIKLNKPVVGMAIDPVTGGYWMDASDGGIFSFHAPFHGSTGNVKLAQPCVGMTTMPDGGGYRFVAADGGIFDFGDAAYEGSAVAPTPVTPSCAVTLSRYNPPDNSEIAATIQSDIPDASVTLKKQYETTTSYDYGSTNQAGATTITFNDSDATPGYRVTVTATVGQAQCSTSFTPS